MRLRLIVLLLLVSYAKGQQAIAHEEMSHEEQLVRTTYAKLSFADEVRIIIKTMDAVPDKWKADERSADKALSSRLEFELTDFKTGPVSEIEGRIVADLAGMPQEGDTAGVLQVTPSTFNYHQGPDPIEWTLYAEVSWNSKGFRRAPGDAWPMAAILKLQEMGGPYDRYAAYTVTVTFQSKSRTYTTAALFGKNKDGSQNVHFLDLISGGMTLDLLAKTDMSTAPFSKTHLRTVPFVRKWLNDNSETCSVKGHGDVCCNTQTKRCGVGVTTLSHRRSRETSNPYLVTAGFHPRVPRPSDPLMFQTSCSAFNTETFFNHGLSDTSGHSTGQHTFTSTIDNVCNYTAGASSPGPCNVKCTASGSGVMTDAGTLSGILPTFHVTATVSATGNAGSTGGGAASCAGNSGGSVVSCVSSTCNVGLSISATQNGIGTVINFPPAAVWNDSNSATQNCLAESSTGTGGAGGGGGTDPCLGTASAPLGGGPVGEFGSGSGGGGNAPDCSPIIIDLTGDGFSLTDAQHGVMFDIANSGTPIQIAWTANANNAWLVLDRNQNGVINSGAEMFGNFTSQPSSPHPNGFAALAVYDDPMNGGNGDGVIDARDRIFSSLRLWVDTNHDGISQPGELHTLPEMGIYSISLDYALSERKDKYGNLFRYRARVNQGLHGPYDVGKTAYDVFLVAQ